MSGMLKFYMLIVFYSLFLYIVYTLLFVLLEPHILFPHFCLEANLEICMRVLLCIYGYLH